MVEPVKPENHEHERRVLGVLAAIKQEAQCQARIFEARGFLRKVRKESI